MTSLMAPQAIDCQSLQFHQICKLNSVSDGSKIHYKNPTNLVASCHLYGLVFIGEKTGIKVIPSGKIYEQINNYNPKNIVTNYIHRNIQLPSPPTHIDVNSDQKLLSVVFILNETPVLRLYNVESLFYPNLEVLNEVRLSSVAGTHLNDLLWNPVNPTMLACCISDGTFTVFSFTGASVSIKSLPKESGSMCASWSPKGKQLVVGNANGYLTQYLPELKIIKNVLPPNEIFNKPCQLMNVKWLSTFQFIGAFREQQPKSGDEEARVCIVVINAPKNGPVTYINYDDVCFSNGTSRPFQFYFFHIAQWNMIYIVSARAVYVGVLSLSPNDQTWYRWNLEESESVVLPINKGVDTYPVGAAIDFSSQLPISIGGVVLTMPIFAILTDEGLLCLYVIKNLQPDIPSICVKSNPIPSLQYFSSSEIVCEPSPQPVIENVTPEASPVRTEPPSFSSASAFNSIAQSFGQPAASINTQTSSTMFGFTTIPKPVSTFELPKAFTQDNVPSSTVQFSQPQQVLNFSPTVSVTQTTPEKPKPVQIAAIVKPAPSVTPVEDPNRKALILQKMREEAMKKLKKRATTFENEIQEFKNLTNKIKVGSNIRSNDKILSQFSAQCTKLKELNENIRNEINNLKTSIIEVTACVKDIKSKQFLLANPGYLSLSNSQNLDAASTASLKKIEKNIYYAQSQIELADKQLDEIWFKFYETSPDSTTKIPKLENIYRTIVVQQKIVNVKRTEVQELEKKLKEIKYRMSLVRPSSSFDDSFASPKSYNTSTAKDDSALAELTKKLLSLENGPQHQLDPNSLAERCQKENARRFMLSYSKQIKLQELHSVHVVNYVRSAKLQRLKKKSLIILSKSNTVESSPQVKEKEHPTEILRQQLISPVSSDDEVYDKREPSVPVALEKVISSTPVKNGANKFSMESFVEEPSVIVTSPQVVTEVEVPKVTIAFPKSVTVEKEKVEKAPVSTISFSSLGKTFQNTSPVTTAQSIFFGAKLTSTAANTISSSGSLFSGLKLSTAVSSVPVPTASSLFGQSMATGMVTTTAVMKDITGSLNLAPKVELKPVAPVTPVIPVTIVEKPLPSLFGSKVLSASNKAVISTPKPAVETQGLFKSLPTSAPPLISMSTPPSTLASVSTTVAFPKSVVVMTVGTPTSTSMFGKPQTSETINFGSFFAQSNSVFGTKPVVPVTSVQPKSEVFSSFSFASKPTSGVVISEISSEISSKPEASVAEPATSAMNSFSFAQVETSTSHTPSKSETASIPSSLTITPVSSPLYLAPVTPVSTPESSPVTSSTAPASAPAPAQAAAPVTSANTNVFESQGTSFFGGLSISATTTTANSMFGKPGPTVFSNNIFSQNANVSSSSGNFFAQKPSTATTTVSLFSPNTSTTTTTNLFANASATTTATTLFSQNTQSTAATPNLFAQTPSTTSATDSKPIFGTGTIAGSSTGTGTGTGTGQSLFGQAPAQENKSVFGQPQSSFQSSGNSMFGGGSIFGGGNAFAGATSTSQSNTFGSSTIFGSANTSFGSTPTNSSFQGTTGGFGSPPSFPNAAQQQQTAGGFGSPPAFSNVFKSNNQFSAFGGAPTFGGSLSYSSPTKLFGQNNSNMNAFGTAGTQQATAFENIANENTMTFGNLAQQQPQTGGFGSPPSFGAPPSAPSFGSSSFGGQSFSSWR